MRRQNTNPDSPQLKHQDSPSLRPANGHNAPRYLTTTELFLKARVKSLNQRFCKTLLWWLITVSNCAVPLELFYIERGCNSRTEIWERETSCNLHAHGCIWCKDKFVLSPLPALPLPLSHPRPPPPINVIRGAGLRLFPPPPPHTPEDYRQISGSLGQYRGRPPFRSLGVLQLNLDSNCDHVQIFGAVIGHLEAEIQFWIFHRKWWKPRRAQGFWHPQRFWQVVPVQKAGIVRERCRP